MSLTKVTTGGINDGSITNAKIHSAADIAHSKLADSGVSAGSYGSATAIPALTINAQGLVTAASTNTVNTTTNLGISTATDSVTVTSSTGNNAQISEASGSAAGVMSVAHHDKLDGIEASATADQTASEIRTLVGNASDSNVLTDALLSKLNGIEASATADQSAAEIRSLVESASDSNVFTDADHSKLNGIEASATADQTASEIRTLVGNATDSNVFTDALLSKLNGIASGATNVTNTNQLTNGAGFITATLTNEQVQDIVGGMVSSNTESGITVTYQDSDGTLDFSVASQTDNNFTNADHSKLDGIESGATADQSASEILTLLKTVDGSGSGLDADTLDGVSSGSFARSDANDTLSGIITLSSSSRDCLNFSANSTDDNRGIAFNGRIALSADYSDGYLRINNASEFSNGVYTPLVFRADGGFQVDSTTVIDGSGNIAYARLTGTPTIPTNNNQLTNGAGYITSFTNNYVSSASFNTGNGVLTLNRSGLGTVTVDLDGRFATGTIPTNNNQLSNGAGYVSSSNQQLAKAFVSFNGYNGSIRADYGVSSVSYNAEGKYQINFSPGIGSANYTAVSACSGRGNVNTANNNSMIHTTMPGNQGGTQISNPSSGSMRLVVLHPANERTQNTSYVSVIVFDT